MMAVFHVSQLISIYYRGNESVPIYDIFIIETGYQQVGFRVKITAYHNLSKATCYNVKMILMRRILCYLQTSTSL